MSSRRHPLFAHLIDYAGLFPPAALDFDPAIRTYARDRAGADAWMLSRFILPAGRLADLEAYLGLFEGEPLRLSVLGHPPDGDAAWIDTARRTLKEARAFEAASGGRAVCDRFEIRVPAPLALDADALAVDLTTFETDLSVGTVAPRVALEVPLLDAPETVAPAAQAVADANGRAGRPAFALKFRCGGVTADLFPTVEGLAQAIAEAIAAGVPFKATAGLHHPVRQYREEVEAPMHGFVNVFGGATLARLHGLDADALAEILDDTETAHFGVADDLRWRSLSATAAEVADAREQLALSYGSCSFDEPREDLRRLGWL